MMSFLSLINVLQSSIGEASFRYPQVLVAALADRIFQKHRVDERGEIKSVQLGHPKQSRTICRITARKGHNA
jgi:hypothetical protein